MAARYWVGGTAAWNGSAGSKWATTSGGVGGAAEPTSSDDVFFDAASGAVTITLTTTVCGNFYCTGFTGTVTGSGQLNLGSPTGGDFVLAAGMTYSATGTIANIGKRLTNIITSAGKSLPAMTFNDGGSSVGKWTLQDNLQCISITLTQGHLDTNGKTITDASFASNNSNVRTLTMTNTAWAMTGSGKSWDITVGTNMTLNATGSSITQSAGNAIFAGGAKTYPTVTFIPSGGNLTYSGLNSIGALTVNGNSSGRLLLSNDVTVTGLFTVASSASSNMSFILSSAPGTQRTISAGSVSLTNHNFQDILAAGASAPWSATSNIGDMGGNSNITFASPVTRYWVGAGTGTVGQNANSFNQTTSWSTSSGGASGASVPLCHDTAIFDALSIVATGRLITINVQCCPELNFSNITNSPTVNTTITNGNCYLKGSLIYKAGMSIAGTTAILLMGRGSHTLNFGGITMTSSMQVTAPGGTYTLAANCVMSNALTMNIGTFDVSSFNFSCTAFLTTNSNVRSVLFRTSTITLTGTGVIWSTVTSTNLTIPATAYTIVLSDVSGSSKTFAGGSQTFANMTITGGGAGAVIFNQPNTFGIVTVGAPKTLGFPNGQITAASQWVFNSSVGNVITLVSNTPGSTFRISQASGLVSADYMNITDSIAQGGAQFWAGKNSTNGGNNTGWIFATFFTITTNDSVTSSDAMTKAVTKVSADSLSISDAIAKAITKRTADEATGSDTLSKAITINTEDSVTTTDSIAKALQIFSDDGVGVSDEEAKAITKIFNDVITTADEFQQIKSIKLTTHDTVTVTDRSFLNPGFPEFSVEAPVSGGAIVATVSGGDVTISVEAN